jgi:HTH-type transcriptional regulator / antitoxin HigA
MDWRVIKTKAEYNRALKRSMAIFQAEPGTTESYELELLLVLIKDYEALIGSKGHVSSILSGRRELTLKMAQKLKDYFHLPADIFMHTA